MKHVTKVILITIVCGVIVLAIGANTFINYTNSTEFCVSCHSMKRNYEEYKVSVHYKNASGVQASCADCHVPKELGPKFYAKIVAVKDVYHEIVGTINTPEKFDERKMYLAERVWEKMQATDSRECRNCHDFRSMDYAKQGRRALNQHTKGFDQGKTCIDCHKGIAHSPPAMYEEDPSAAMPAK